MSTKIRLSRAGKKSQPFFRVVVIDESFPRNGRPIEVVGHYDPRKEPSIFEVRRERVEEWLKKGAVPSDVVRKYLGKIGILSAVDFSKKKKKSPKGAEAANNSPKKEPESAPQASAA